MLAILEKANDSLDVFNGETGFSGNLGLIVAATLKTLDVMEQVDGPMLAPGKVFDQTHDRAIFGIGVDNESGNLGLAKCLIGFEPALATDQVITRSIRRVV